MITSNMTRAGRQSRIIVTIGSETARGCGLLTDAVITTDNLATILDSEIDRVIGSFRETAEIDAALRATLSL